MRLSRTLLSAALLLATPAFAQQPDPAFLQRLVRATQEQRNAANDVQAAAIAQIGMLGDEIEKLKAKVSDLEKQLADAKAPKD